MGISQYNIDMPESEDKYSRFLRETNIDLQAEIAAGGSEDGLENYYTKLQTNSLLETKANTSVTDSLDNRLTEVESGDGTDLTNYYNKTQTDTLLSAKADDVDFDGLDSRITALEDDPDVGVTDHGLLTGLADDDHIQYHTDTRGDVRYYTKSQIDTSLAGKSDTSHNHDTRYYTESEVDTLLSGKQTADSDLTALAGLSPTNDDIVQRKAGVWTNRTPTQVKTDLSLTKSDVGLSNVDNTTDLNKPVSTATTTALSGKADTVHVHAAADTTSGIFNIARIPTGVTGSTVSLGDHTHDSRYYTETETDTLLTGKASSTHTHNANDVNAGVLGIARIPTGSTNTTVPLGDHTHDTRYYTETEMDASLALKTNVTTTTTLQTDVNTRAKDNVIGSGQVRAVKPIRPYNQDTAHSAFPSVAIMTDGTMIMVYRQGTDHSATRDGVIKKATSTDNGRTWSAPTTLMSGAAGTDLRDPCISLSRDGTKLYLTYFKATSILAAAGVFFRSSTDAGANWATEVRVDATLPYAASSGPVVELDNNTLVVPYYGRSGAETWDSVWTGKSTNGGTTWPTNTRILNGQTATNHYQEPWIALSGQTAVLSYRHGTAASIGMIKSTDNTVNWSAASAKFAGTGRATIFWANADTLACIYRKLSGGDAVIRSSRDTGTSWYPERFIEASASLAGWMTYAGVARLSNGASVCVLANEVSTSNSRVHTTYIGESGVITPFGAIPNGAEAGASNLDGVAFATCFEQPDGTLGYPWTVVTGAVTVTNGELLSASADNVVDIVSINTSQNDMEVEAEIYNGGTATMQSGSAIIFRMTAPTTYLMWTIETQGGNFRLYQVVSGTATQIAIATPGTPSFSFNTYNKYKVIARGDKILCFFNDVMWINYDATSILSTFSTGFLAGIKLNSQGTTTHKCRRFIARR